ncbi:flagellar assembly peptidoglycan hydrolase FlgJ [Halomonas mongoliensis]|uniref:Peptidoglycan hydrolase FlgJ n=1 Tax=Halomonas mongoliensis TaxID=321265 RepID=A0ABU1GMV2_9GAMM|nr:flagellar assembly peptidoglycan hydrolase FlgJ [Halomonas mongoliensis]MDR5893360.1 flagellar assembly peptidoglycan hydrolase FlgJ [Halomonas mongoliensis]
MSLPDASGQFALDVQGLNRLRYSARHNPEEGVRGAAEQFEALFIQMMLKSMRDTIPKSDLMESQATEMYQSMLDQQWSQVMATRGIGLADKLVAQLERSGVVSSESQRGSAVDELIAGIPRGTPRPLRDALIEGDPEREPAPAPRRPPEESVMAAPSHFLEALQTESVDFMARIEAARSAAETTVPAAPPVGEAAAVAPAPARERAGSAPDHVQAFLNKLASPAAAASQRTGVPAELILAQAALETGWGRHEIATADGRNSHNLFGIKAGSRWQGPTTEVVTHEYLDGRRTRVTDGFRVYDSFEEAFTDYARLIGENPRYAGVASAATPEQAARALQSGGYATDPAYADKLIAVMGTLEGAERTLASAAGQRPDDLVFLRY